MIILRGLLIALLVIVTLAGNAHHANAQVLGTVNFDFDSDALSPQGQAQVAEIAKQIKARDGIYQVVVTGHTDAVGSPAYNDGLGLRRARQVATALTTHGIAVSRISTVQSRGERDLVVQVSTPERLNRRVTVSHSELLAACKSYRSVLLPQPGDDALVADLAQRRDSAAALRASLAATGASSAVYQVAGAAVDDCSTAAGFHPKDGRFEEYAKRCICNSARISLLQ